jgi:hypothetical protein
VTDPRIGTTLDERYRIVGRLAAGGMGVVYRGERLGLGRSVAIKFLHAHMAADRAFLERFAIEAQAMARLQHPNCAAVIDHGVAGEEPYVVMDLVAGESLRSLLDRGRLPAWRALGIMRQVLAGLAHAHEQGITHRDIKPDNVMVEATGAFGDQVRILDFGLAKLRASTSTLTTGFVVGTPSYMAPEQTLAQPVDERTDIYACGVVLFEMLTGTKPFRAAEAAHVLRMHRETPPPRLADLAPDAGLSDEIESAVLQALSKAPSHRFASAAAFATALDHVPEAAARAGSAPPIARATASHTTTSAGARPAAAALGTAPTEWSHPASAQPGPGTHATEQLGASQIEVVVSGAMPAPSVPDGHVGTGQVQAFAAALAEPGAARPALAHETSAARPDTSIPATRTESTAPAADPRASARDAKTPPSAQPTGARAGARDATPAPALPAPAKAASSRRRGLWLGLGAAAGALLLVLLVLPGGEDAQVFVPVDALPGPDGELMAAIDQVEPGQVEPGLDPAAGDAGQSDEIALAGADAAVPLAPGDPTGPGTPIEAPDPARSGVKLANQAVPPSLAQAEALLDQGRAAQARKLLEKLRGEDRDDARRHYLLGRAYFAELWVRDGLGAFREAIALDPAYRSHRGLIESAVAGLASDSEHYAVSGFLVREIGRDARPALEELAARHHRDDVRERASRALRLIR